MPGWTSELQARHNSTSTSINADPAHPVRVAADDSHPELRQQWDATIDRLYADRVLERVSATIDPLVTGRQHERLVQDEIGSPSFTEDVAEGIRALLAENRFGVQHVVNSGRATRAEWAQLVLDLAGIDVPTELVPASTWKRDSTPPRFAVLASDVQCRPWQDATRAYVGGLVAPSLAV